MVIFNSYVNVYQGVDICPIFPSIFPLNVALENLEDDKYSLHFPIYIYPVTAFVVNLVFLVIYFVY